jgi:hypothetical protein
MFSEYLEEDYVWSFTTATNSLKGITTQGDYTQVSLTGKVISMINGSFGYIQEPDRTSGIRIQGYISGYEDQIVDTLSGTMMTTPGGERYIDVSNMYCGAYADVLPLGANNKAIRSDLMNGLLVKAWGKVISIGYDSYVISDGSDEGLTVRTQGTPTVGQDQPVAVTGAAGYDNGRVIYAR